MRVNAERKDRGKKLMQVLLIRTAEKTERKKKSKKEDYRQKKRTTPCREDFLVLYFSNYHSVVRKSVCVCVSKVCVYASCIINASCI